MVTQTNDDFYCPRCGISDNTKQTVTDIPDKVVTGRHVVSLQQLNCGNCKFTSYIGVTNE
ncbi:MAG TPA: hypothetical protein VL854_03210 [Nitrososphaeraceae archaeon]|nr:hypothetical protein [Nitrososphaeraceae archaeon]